jgi:hypothetical protein
MPWTFAGVIVSTVPTSSPVAGLNDSSAGFAFVLALAFERFVEALAPLPLPLALDFFVLDLRALLASIAASSRRFARSRR